MLNGPAWWVQVLRHLESKGIARLGSFTASVSMLCDG